MQLHDKKKRDLMSGRRRVLCEVRRLRVQGGSDVSHDQHVRFDSLFDQLY